MTIEQLDRLTADAKRARSAYLGSLPDMLKAVLDGWAYRLARQRMQSRRPTAFVATTR